MVAFAPAAAVASFGAVGLMLADAGAYEPSFQFPHLLPSLLAQARSIGGDRLMFMLPPILGGVALLAFFVVASRVLRNPAVALGATACLAFVMPQVYFSRDAYSEIPMQV